jgi:hypothetical protein
MGRTARAWVELTRRLGYERYGVHGGDVGAGVSAMVAGLDREHVIGVHVVTDPLTAANTATFLPGMADRLDENDQVDKLILDRMEAFRKEGPAPGDPEQPAADHRLRPGRLAAAAADRRSAQPLTRCLGRRCSLEVAERRQAVGKRAFPSTSRERFPCGSTVRGDLGERRRAQRFPGFC